MSFQTVEDLDELDDDTGRPAPRNSGAASRVDIPDDDADDALDHADDDHMRRTASDDLDDPAGDDDGFEEPAPRAAKAGKKAAAETDEDDSAERPAVSPLKKYMPYLFLGGFAGLFAVVVAINMGGSAPKQAAVPQPPVRPAQQATAPQAGAPAAAQAQAPQGVQSPFSTASIPVPAQQPATPAPTASINPAPAIAANSAAGAAINANIERLAEMQTQITKLADTDTKIIGQLDTINSRLGDIQTGVYSSAGAVEALRNQVGGIETRLTALEAAPVRKPQPTTARAPESRPPQAAPQTANTVEPASGTVYASKPGGFRAVNLRSAPGGGAQVIGQVQAGEAMTITGRTGSWLQVSANGMSGFVAAGLVSKEPFQAAAPQTERSTPAPRSTREAQARTPTGSMGVQSAMPGRAWLCQVKTTRNAKGCLEGSVREVRIGDQVPAMGYVVDIRPDATGRSWEVVTEKGIVSPVRL